VGDIASANSSSGEDTLLGEVSPTGATLWDRTHPMSASSRGGPRRIPVLSGFQKTRGGGATFAKFNASGELLWTHTDASAVGLLLHSAMLIDADRLRPADQAGDRGRRRARIQGRGRIRKRFLF